MMWWLISSSFAASLLYTEDVSTDFADVVVSENQQWVAFSTTNQGQIHLLSTLTWKVTTIDACDDAVGGLAFDGDNILWLGCAGEGVIGFDPSTMLETAVIDVDATEFLQATIYNEDLYIVAKQSNGGNPRVHLVDLATQTESSAAFPSTLAFNSALDLERVGNYLVSTHGSTNVSKIDPISGAIVRDQQGPSMGVCSDILPESSGSNPLIAAGTAGIYRFLYSSNMLQFASGGSGLNDATALMTWQEQLWVADAGSNNLKAFAYTSGSGNMGTEQLDTVALTFEDDVLEMVSIGDYLILGTEGGSVGIVGVGPWVDVSEIDPNVLGASAEFSLSFTSSQSGTYSIRANASNNEDGTEIINGTIEADATQSLTLLSDGAYIEGENSLRVVVTSEEGVGYDTVYFSVDTPPSTPVLTSDDIGFGDEKAILQLTGISDADLSHFQVFISDQVFSASDYVTGGPILDIYTEDDLQVDMVPDETVEFILTGLSNDVEYYIAVRAYDQAGAESEMSAVHSIIPKKTQSAAELSGENGGFCGTQTPLSIISMIGAMMLVGLRRNRIWMPVVLSTIITVSMSNEALATSQMSESAENTASLLLPQEAPNPWVHSFVNVHYGPITLDSQVLNAVFTQSNHQALYVDAGYSLRHVLGISAGFGLLREKGYLLSSDLSSSSQEDLLNVIPLNLSVIARADFLKDQLLVPFASAGLDYWLWQEKWTENDSDVSMSGGKQGYHYALGGQLLLDPFDEVAASLLEVTRGIEDTYLSVEYRVQEFDTEGISFDSNSLTVGFRFNY